MASHWVVDSNCFIHLGSMARDGFLSDLNDILRKESTSLHVTPGVHDEIRTVRFQRWKGKPNLLEKFSQTLTTVSVSDGEISNLAQTIGEKSSPQDVDLSLMVLSSKLSQEGHSVTLVSDDYKMTTTANKVNLKFETCPPSTFLQRLADQGDDRQRSRLRSLSRRVRAAEMKYAISRAGQYDIQKKLTWMVDSLLSTKLVADSDVDDQNESDESALVKALIRSLRGERVKNSYINKLGSLPDSCSPVTKLDDHLSSLTSSGNLEDIGLAYEECSDLLSEVLEATGLALAPLGEELAEIAHRAMAGYFYRTESALGMLSRMSGNFKRSRLHLSRALSNATLVDDRGAEMRAMHQLGLLALASKNWKRATELFEVADRQAQSISANRLAHLVLASVASHLSENQENAKQYLKLANDILSKNKPDAVNVLISVGTSLLAVDCPGLAIEILDEAMECAIEVGLDDELDLLAETLLLANTALSEREQSQYEGLRQLLDDLNILSGEIKQEFESAITDIEAKVESLSKPLDDTWKDWQPAAKLIPEGSDMTVIRIERDESGRVLVVSHHTEIGSVGIWLPEGGVEASPGNIIQLNQSRIKVAPPTKELQENHNIRGIIAIENSDGISFGARSQEILDDDDEEELSSSQ